MAIGSDTGARVGSGPGHARRGRTRVWPLVIVAALVVGALVGAGVVLATRHGSSGSSTHHSPAAGGPTAPASTSPTTSAQAELVAAVTSDPADGATAVTPDTSVVVRTSHGRLTSVSVATTTGHTLAGRLDPAGTGWTSAAALLPSSHYVVRAVVTGDQGVQATTSSTFTTVTPTAMVSMTVWPEDGLTVGVGQPIVLKFSQPIITPSARTGVLTHLHVAMTHYVPVGAYWFSNYELHLRPATYWPRGEQISFSDDLDGWNAGSGEWGQGSGSVKFGVGDVRISTANLATHEMSVTVNGKVVATYPISGGSDQFPTMNGTHIVLDRQSKVQMISSSVGIPVNSPNGYNETVYWDVHISDSGEYVHAAPWSVGAQGNTNVSHGCINLAPANAESYFNLSRVGDIVNVTGGPRPPSAGDHGVMDWSTVPWRSFTPVHVAVL